MKYLIFFCSLFVTIFSCKKDDSPIITPPPPIDTTQVNVPIYEPGDTSLGASYAKKLTANWSAEAICLVQSYFDTNYVGILFSTYSNAGYQREALSFSLIPRFAGEKSYGLKKMSSNTLHSDFVSPSYSTFKSDGDVLEDYYNLDTTATDNHFTVGKLDLITNRIECTFTATFKIVEPRQNAVNPKTVKFSEGRAWAVIQN